MLEFHPTLAIAAHIPATLKHAFWVSSLIVFKYIYYSCVDHQIV